SIVVYKQILVLKLSFLKYVNSIYGPHYLLVQIEQQSLFNSSIFNTNFAFFGKELNGQQEPRPRWKRAISEMSGTSSLGFAIGKIYVARYFPESSKQQMSELVENLRTALG
ncbi:M13 family metallopeptidase N-terminal domain-containing protein, partial [Pseudoalteromonas sp. 24-MNA-CIBAN-0067]|uniref:M13 family metallopeptidase N-terminal domain-containing protein n=1 Tax=Pseudoalteromonas sp. 24-MNA-CIBAN-0067 TaxID=3140423 RepID=UPI00332D7BB6